MSAYPSPSVFVAARRRHHDALLAAFAGAIVIAGASYPAAVALRKGEMELQDGGTRITDVLTIRIAKAALASPPGGKFKLTWNALEWITDGSISGQEAWAVEWVFTATKA